MSTIPVRVGVPQIFLSIDDNATAVPNISSLTPGQASGFTATAITPLDQYLNDVQAPLSASDTYAVTIALVGRDLVNGGYTVTPAAAPVTGITVTAGQGIQVKVANANWPANFSEAIACAVFLKTNAGNYQIAKFAYIDSINDFYTVIMAKPLKVAPSFTLTVLQSFNNDPAQVLGSRVPYGITFSELTPTTGAFNFRRGVSNVTISPNTGPDFQVATTRAPSVRFTTLANDIKAIVQSAGGNYVKYSDSNNVTHEEGEASLATAQAILRNNRALQVIMPADPNGYQEVRLLIGQLVVNQQEVEEAWSKTAPTPITFQFDAAVLDKLITNQHTEIQYKVWK